MQGGAGWRETGEMYGGLLLMLAQIQGTAGVEGLQVALWELSHWMKKKQFGLLCGKTEDTGDWTLILI